MKKKRRALAVLKLLPHVPDKIKQLHAIILAMTGNSWFLNQVSLVNALAALLNVLIAAESNPTGTIEARDAALHAAVVGAETVRNAVQSVADANPDNAEVIIVSAGMSVKAFTPRAKNSLMVKQGDVSGLVLLIAVFAGAKACYMWEWSTDQKAWTSLPPIFKSTSSVGGLTPATMYYFRYKTVTPGATSDWSQVVSLLVT